MLPAQFDQVAHGLEGIPCFHRVDVNLQVVFFLDGDQDLDEDLYVYVVNSLDALEQAEAGYRRAIELKPKAREICIW